VAVADKESEISDYQRKLDEGEGIAESPEVPEFVRDTAFSRIVRRAYDYRCAACGLRVVLEGGLYIVDAAHLIPFAETHDDDPRNGIALCKNHHWAMKLHRFLPLLIALCFASIARLVSARADEPLVIHLWEKGAPGFESRRDEPEVVKGGSVSNVHNPSITVFPAPPASQSARRWVHVLMEASLERAPMVKPWPPLA